MSVILPRRFVGDSCPQPLDNFSYSGNILNVSSTGKSWCLTVDYNGQRYRYGYVLDQLVNGRDYVNSYELSGSSTTQFGWKPTNTIDPALYGTESIESIHWKPDGTQIWTAGYNGISDTRRQIISWS